MPEATSVNHERAAHQAPADPTAGELVKQLSEQTSRLVRQEVALAQAELKEKGKRAGLAGGLFGGAGMLAFYAVGALIATAILAISEATEPWLAGLIVTVVLAAMAGVAALVGRQQAREATPPVPERARDGVQEDVRTIKESAAR